MVRRHRSHGIVIDVAALDMIDSSIRSMGPTVISPAPRRLCERRVERVQRMLASRLVRVSLGAVAQGRMPRQWVEPERNRESVCLASP